MPMHDYPNPHTFEHPNICSRRTMPPTTTVRDEEPRRRRRKDPDGSERDRDRERDRDSTSSRDKQHRREHKISSSTRLHRKRSTSRERNRDRDSPRSTVSDRGSKRDKRVEMVVPEMERRTPSGTGSGIDVRPQSSYPSFSKAHSREAVHILDTPAATDVSPEKRRNSTPAKPPTNTPPSPPLTADNPDIRRSGSGSSISQAADEAKVNMSEGRRSMDGTPKSSAVRSAKSGASLRREAAVQFDADLDTTLSNAAELLGGSKFLGRHSAERLDPHDLVQKGIPAMALDHPICETSNYADMFSCYQYVTESHCSSTSPVPYGVCNRNGPDTSPAVQQSKSAAARTSPGSTRRWTLALGGLVACTTIQLLAS